MKKVILAALNAKYIHSSLALRYLTKFQKNAERHDLEAIEFTINQRLDYILEELFQRKPDVVLFSCYLWNVEMLRELSVLLKKVMPQCVIGFGGPEVSYESEAFLRDNPAVDLIMRGEGELVMKALLEHWDTGVPQSLEQIGSLTFRKNGEIFSTAMQPPLDLSLLPFPYEDDFSDVENQIIYYESSRGCPYHCGYCLSSVEQGVRFAPLEKVLPELQKFLDANVKQVKFIDRTFNCKKSHAMAIWRYLHTHDNGVTNFHFEITADLIDQETIDFLKTVRKGLFQFEIGVQSTNPETIRAIDRNVDFASLAQVVRQIKAGDNIHQHLDLIAGLPYEDYASFARSFNDVYALQPEQLQLGFLKVLKGSMLYQRQKEYAISYRDRAPYEVLSTHELPFSDTIRLKYIEEMVETYYNSGRFLHTLAYLVPLYDSPFAFFEALSEDWVAAGNHYRPLPKLGVYDALHTFALKAEKVDQETLEQLLKFDLLLYEKPKKLPQWLIQPQDTKWQQTVNDLYHATSFLTDFLPHYADRREAMRQTHLERFLHGGKKEAVLFDYGKRDLLQNAAYTVFSEEQIHRMAAEGAKKKN